MMCISTTCGRPQGGEGVMLMWTHVGRGSQNSWFSCGRHK